MSVFLPRINALTPKTFWAALISGKYYLLCLVFETMEIIIRMKSIEKIKGIIFYLFQIPFS